MFAAVLGFTWLATVPPTAGLIGKLFGVRYLATLFGLATLTHQIGGFFGAWLGGIALTTFGDFSWMWYADIALALAAAFVNLPIREAPRASGASAGPRSQMGQTSFSRGSSRPCGRSGGAVRKHLRVERRARARRDDRAARLSSPCAGRASA